MRRKIKDELGNLWIIPSSEYEGFSKQDLKDRHDALKKEYFENSERNIEIFKEAMEIEKLLEEK